MLIVVQPVSNTLAPAVAAYTSFLEGRHVLAAPKESEMVINRLLPSCLNDTDLHLVETHQRRRCSK